MDKNQRHKSFYITIAIIGLILLMLQIGIYQKTIISLKIPFALTLVVAVIGFLIIQRDYRRTYQNKNLFFPFAQSFISFGFIACYLFMASNYFFADNSVEIKAFPILTKYTIGTGSHEQPAIEIDYGGTKKQLVFFNWQQKQLDTSHQVLLTVRKGLLGFAIFSDIQLK
jgi:hypothetical protein